MDRRVGRARRDPRGAYSPTVVHAHAGDAAQVHESALALLANGIFDRLSCEQGAKGDDHRQRGERPACWRPRTPAIPRVTTTERSCLRHRIHDAPAASDRPGTGWRSAPLAHLRLRCPVLNPCPLVRVRLSARLVTGALARSYRTGHLREHVKVPSIGAPHGDLVLRQQPRPSGPAAPSPLRR
jgi:hypothetical protein